MHNRPRPIDRDFHALIDAIAGFFNFGHGAPTDPKSWRRFRDRYERHCEMLVACVDRLLPELAHQFDFSEPTVVRAKRIVAKGIEGLDDPLLIWLWDNYIQTPLSLTEIPAEVAHDLVSPRSMYRAIKRLPFRVATYLWEKNDDLVGRQRVVRFDPLTVRQHRLLHLRDSFDLSLRQAEILLHYLEYQSSNRTLVATARMLSVSVNTLKSHKKAIITRMRVTTMSQAVTLAHRALSLYLPAQWPQPSSEEPDAQAKGD